MFVYIFNIFLLLVEVFQLLLKAAFAVVEAFVYMFIPRAHKSIEGENALITGAGHGLGRELALQLADLGVRLVLWDIDQKAVERTAADVRRKGGVVFAYHCDVTDEQKVEFVANEVRREVGDVTILINNAGIMHCQTLLCLNDQQIRRTLEINTLSHFWTVRQFLPRMLELGHGHIVAIASIAGILGCANLVDYCASKFGVVGFMAALAEEVYADRRDHCIHLTTVCPSTMNTRLTHYPRTRFPRLLPILEVDEVAQRIINAVLQNQQLLIIPSRIEFITRITGIFPRKVTQMFQHFLDYAVDPHEPRPQKC
ncbi:17-beta-hydroxysteroid dehydrogenase 13-like isoform X1 [Limulus polyphemus]|uniref:17-beta-hydroxysteroid dehydrogenase 13-like isoform X1 n=1 Tax=Limulus polyphemus TaxID=6850 RepID=A0ABM1B2Q7_LIMPO|nr:17-beta-hydroxysteroid dehydrogenase 13-like isoform X1 [Limulus polyphemus]